MQKVITWLKKQREPYQWYRESYKKWMRRLIFAILLEAVAFGGAALAIKTFCLSIESEKAILASGMFIMGITFGLAFMCHLADNYEGQLAKQDKEES